MVDYEFYVNHYLGSAIPEKAFSGLAAQAKEYLDNLKAVCRVASSGQEAECMALCAMAETLWRWESLSPTGSGAVTSASVGSVSVSYATDSGDGSPKAQAMALFRAAERYLQIYRGCGR